VRDLRRAVQAHQQPRHQADRAQLQYCKATMSP
jgi:hypothetical protein